jgi:ABC-type cobalamin/Fe3+-siderophores transport system ATPase subunit
VADHEEFLPKLSNVEVFKEEIWKSYFKAQIALYLDLISKYQAAEKRKKEIEEEAGKQRTQWESVIEIFNKRFFVPFKLIAKNRVSVILGQESLLSLGFIFEDGQDTAPMERQELMKVLSTGEKKALYILNVIFEIEARKKAKQETLFIFDDIADSFDYKNKYAIIQYLSDIAQEPHFNQIMMTHNFDFFRTVNSRFVNYSHCLIALKNSQGISLKQATGIKNIFVNDWKPNFFADPKKKIASIPFIRNIVEFTKGEKDPSFIRLTAILHWKDSSSVIKQNDLDSVYNIIFTTAGASSKGNELVVDMIKREADECLKAGDGVNFENKIVLSIAIRIFAEKFMVEKINDPNFVKGIDSNQTPKLLDKFKALFPKEIIAIEIMQRVILMTPENIHLNSFMYEPILDMSDDHLRKLYTDVLTL